MSTDCRLPMEEEAFVESFRPDLMEVRWGERGVQREWIWIRKGEAGVEFKGSG